MLGAITAYAAGKNFATLGDVFLQAIRVFEIDVFDFIGTEIAGLASAGRTVASTSMWSSCFCLHGLSFLFLEWDFVFRTKDGIQIISSTTFCDTGCLQVAFRLANR